MRRNNAMTNFLLVGLILIALYVLITKPVPTQRINTSALIVDINPTPTPRPSQTPRVETDNDDGVPARVTVVVIVTATPEAAPAATPEATAAPTASPAPQTTPEPPMAPVEVRTVYTPNNDWRVDLWQDLSWGPELGFHSPGFGVGENEIGTIVGHNLVFHTAEGDVELGPCAQAVLPPNTYAWNMGGQDWGARGWRFNPEVTNAWNEMLVLSWELAEQQIEWETDDCQPKPPTEMLAHVMVVEQDPDNKNLVKLTPFFEYRVSTGEDNALMFGPGQIVYAWHCGLDLSETEEEVDPDDPFNYQHNIKDEGDCLIVAPWFGWFGGGTLAPWAEEIADLKFIEIDDDLIHRAVAQEYMEYYD